MYAIASSSYILQSKQNYTQSRSYQNKHATLMSISSTFYEQLVHKKVLFAAFLS